ncbi:acetate/propionate family kinase [Mycoplasma sp. Ms02]|uniref:acetate/propionate family kinase n=1 Tax=Mycoplasma sp. Ms02 TaxID=353851 RepID=UPI001C8AA149|nr:acetate/propionate family kinase [Mycoplasma sp. Ms02]QZE12263.1 acetate/propionate family kinase [Mycoplasma sp. Ms02]
MVKKVLAINPGSSSIKYKLYVKDTLEAISSGGAERIGLPNGEIKVKFNGTHIRTLTLDTFDKAVSELIKLMKEVELISNPEEIEYIGYRLVHGGEEITKSTKITMNEIQTIEKLSYLAPLHNPGAAQSMKSFQKFIPSAKMAAELDSEFHQTIEKVNYTYPISKKITEKYGIKKYGAHGVSHRYITQRMEELLGKKGVNIVNMHLGNGASLCAISNSKSIDTSMGMTPLAGIFMGTRSGDIDPSIHEILKIRANMTIEEVTQMLNNESGLEGVSGVSSDIRDVVSAANNGNEQAQFTLELYSRKIADYAINYANKVGNNLEALVFTGGIGENTPSVRKRVIEMLPLLNIEFDDKANSSSFEDDYKIITKPESKIQVYVVRTDEEIVIAKDAIKFYEEENV